MGNPKQKWTAEEEEALRAGVAKHGTGKWKNIQKDPEFNHHLYTRSNIDLKDKWRNMSVSAGGQGPRDKSSRMIKPKSESDATDASFTPGSAPAQLLLTNTPAGSSTTPVAASSTSPAPASSISPTHDALPVAIFPPTDSKCSLDVKTASKYDSMIYDALKNLNDANGSDATSIVGFIEQKQEVPQNFRRLLVSRLRRLVTQEKLEKVQNCYRTKNDAALQVNNCYKTKNDAAPGVKAPTPKTKEIRPRQPQPTSYLPDTVHDAAKNAAFKVAVADNKESVAAESGKESDRINKMTEDAEMLLKVAEDIFDRCARGEIVMVS